MSLKSGHYHIFSVSFATGAPVTRPIGPCQANNGRQTPLVVRPLGTIPATWNFQQVSGNTYVITLDGASVRIVNGPGCVVLSDSKLPPFEWSILRGAPHPPPIGVDAFGITAANQHPQQSWVVPYTGGDQAREVQLEIGGSASTLFIVPGPP